MNTASRSSASLLRCCRASTSGSSGSASRTSAPAVGTFALQPQHHPNGQIAALSTSARPCYPSTPLHKPPPSRHKTPKGTNAKPAAKGRPNRYDTTYGIPPLNPALYKRGPEKLDRNKFEKAQRPEWERIWKLEDEIATTASESKKAQLAEQLQQLKANQPWRHPLWAFFHEKSRTEYEEELREREQAGLTDDFPGAYSLAYSLEAPNKAEGTSGRAWHAEELRRKSFDDLHRLWYILSIERNALYTQRDEGKRQGVQVSDYTFISEKLHRCRKSMARIKYILHERRTAAREAQAILRESRREGGAKQGSPEEKASDFMELEQDHDATRAQPEPVRA